MHENITPYRPQVIPPTHDGAVTRNILQQFAFAVISFDPRAQTDDVVCARPRSFGVRAERSRAVARAEVFSFSQVAHRLNERAANPRAGCHLMERQRGQFPLVAAPAATHRSRSRPLAHG